MNILVVGSGGREHALCWKIAASPLCTALYCAPGNAGIAQEAECLPVKAGDIDGLVAKAQQKAIDLVVIGPEEPLCAGLVDRMEAAGIAAFGPNADAAILEGSKGFMKDLCAKYDIPTAAYRRFTDTAEAKAFIAEKDMPIVVKADGLAAGKGVIVAQSADEAEAAVTTILQDRAFGSAGAEIIVEEFLEGEEASILALVDGEHFVMLPSVQDHKAVGEGDTGPNTGGMGAYSPAPIVTDALTDRIRKEIMARTVAAMAAEGRPFKGVLYAGLMIGPDGPKVLEFNIRFGDPECQPLMMRLMSDLLPALIAARDGELKAFDLRWYAESAMTVVLATKGYPGDYERDTEICGLDTLPDDPNTVVFHAGTSRDGDRILTTGGRSLGVTTLAPTITEAQKKAYAVIDAIDWPEGFCRRDIGWRVATR
ncbi:MAG: phosphoribosylamine--glycine ligase [Rhodospirillaceae bacterium]|nr:phosphoribosylamine--glycine ligase [Rhodospirillaceae bacterium]